MIDEYNCRTGKSLEHDQTQSLAKAGNEVKGIISEVRKVPFWIIGAIISQPAFILMASLLSRHCLDAHRFQLRANQHSHNCNIYSESLVYKVCMKSYHVVDGFTHY